MPGNNGRMSDHIYKKIELVGSSPNGFEEAVKNALARAEKTVRNMRWFEVAETRGYIENGKIGHWQGTLKIGFTLEKGFRGVCAKRRLKIKALGTSTSTRLIPLPELLGKAWSRRRLRSPVSLRRRGAA